eukprot:SAG31_NODE_1365_length_8621_cov_61.731049_4_plen_189_part_00
MIDARAEETAAAHLAAATKIKANAEAGMSCPTFIPAGACASIFCWYWRRVNRGGWPCSRCRQVCNWLGRDRIPREQGSGVRKVRRGVSHSVRLLTQACTYRRERHMLTHSVLFLRIKRRTIVEALPAVAERIAAPLAQTEKMVFISSDGQAGKYGILNPFSSFSGQPVNTNNCSQYCTQRFGVSPMCG